MPSMQIPVLALIALGTIVGTVDVISVAFAEQQGQPAAASIVLSVYAFGSCPAGLIFGAIKIPVPCLVCSYTRHSPPPSPPCRCCGCTMS